MAEGKICSTCKIFKPYSEFHKTKSSKDNFNCQCKACRKAKRDENKEHHNAVAREYARQNAEHRKEVNKKWYLENKEYKSEYGKEYYQENKEQVQQTHKKYNEENSEKVKLQQKAWYEENKERVLEYQREYTSKEEVKQMKYETSLKWKEKNPEKVRSYSATRRARKNSAEGFYTSEDIFKMFEEQNSCCFYCGKDISEYYEVDHKHPIKKGGSNWPENLVLACKFCNRSKGAKTLDEFLAYRKKVELSDIKKLITTWGPL